MIENHTVRLDGYADRLIRHHAVTSVNGHLYDFYPIGTPILSVPAVYIANRFGMDILVPGDMSRLHIILVSAVLTLIFANIFAIGRCYVSTRASFLITAVSFFGSSLSSTMMTELWSHNYAMFFTTLSLLLIGLYETGRIKELNPYLLGILLFCAYLCRPTSSIFAISVFAYLFFRDRRALVKTALAALLPLLLFMSYSSREYGNLMPPYYMLSLGGSDFLTSFYGVTFSPSRGLFIFSPFLLAVFAGIVLCFKDIKGNAVFRISLLWFALHLIILSNWGSWWGATATGRDCFRIPCRV